MDEELQKRKTDCVYFMAYPLACRKGPNCEYRHSDVARLNQIDCWYWLAGNCLNPTCGYRHPPLLGYPQRPPEPVLNQPVVPVNKGVVPCRYFYNGYCNKGEKCIYLHESYNYPPPRKNSSLASVNAGGLQLEKKASMGSDESPRPVERQTNSFDADKRTARGDRPVGFIQRRAYVSSEVISGDPMEVCDERLQPSPGSNVLANVKVPDCEDVPEYSRHHAVGGGEYKDRNLMCDYEENDQYNSAYPREHYSHFGGWITHNYVREIL